MSRQLSFAWNAVTNFRKWLDISGGTRLIYRISYDNYEQTYSGNSQALDEIKRTVENIILKNIDGRISQLWVSDYKSFTQKLDNETQIVVEIWWVADLDQAKELIGKTVELEFKLPNEKEWSEEEKNERIAIAQNL
jgi:preprotein translocase subunit SecD